MKTPPGFRPIPGWAIDLVAAPHPNSQKLRRSPVSTFPEPYNVWGYDDLTYDFVAPMATLDDLAKLPATFATLAAKMGEAKFADLMSRANSTSSPKTGARWQPPKGSATAIGSSRPSSDPSYHCSL